MKAAELRDKTVEELHAAEGDLRKELFNLRFQQATGEIQDPNRLRSAKREIARILGVVTEKERQKGDVK
jgi:large subunit ribosomal protein L29